MSWDRYSIGRNNSVRIPGPLSEQQVQEYKHFEETILMSQHENRSAESRYKTYGHSVPGASLTVTPGAVNIKDKTVEVDAVVSIKHDSEKPAVQYIPMEALFAMGEAYGYGAKKYASWNFMVSGLEVTRCLAASVRHIYLFLSGEDNDKESGLSHLGHAMAAIGMAVYSLHNHPNKDDRFKK